MESFHNRSLVSITQLNVKEVVALFKLADSYQARVKAQDKTLTQELQGRVLGLIFYEPSTRTSSSFHAAMVRLGGAVLPVNESTSSVVKGETLGDTIRTIASYTDIIVLRHPEAGSALEASKVSSKPVINAGDGTGEHPTQALLDLYTFFSHERTENKFRITFLGDLKHGRTVHSLLKLLSMFPELVLQILLIAPPGLGLPSSLLEEIRQKGLKVDEATKLEEEYLTQTDILYVTRVQKERFSSLDEYEKFKGSYVIDLTTAKKLPENALIMHPLPRVGEILPEVDSDKRAAYFKQMENGLYVRMALIATTLGVHTN